MLVNGRISLMNSLSLSSETKLLYAFLKEAWFEKIHKRMCLAKGGKKLWGPLSLFQGV